MAHLKSHSWLLVEPREEFMFMWLQAHVSSFVLCGWLSRDGRLWDHFPGILPRHSSLFGMSLLYGLSFAGHSCQDDL